MAWGPLLVGVASVLVSGWMIITLSSAESLAAGWRHELICLLLASFAIYAVTWAQGRPWPQPAAVVATCSLLLVLAVLILPLPHLPALGATAALIACGAAAVVPAEVRRARRAPRAWEVVVLLALADLAAITPVFVLLTLVGTLR